LTGTVSIKDGAKNYGLFSAYGSYFMQLKDKNGNILKSIVNEKIKDFGNSYKDAKERVAKKVSEEIYVKILKPLQED